MALMSVLLSNLVFILAHAGIWYSHYHPGVEQIFITDLYIRTWFSCYLPILWLFLRVILSFIVIYDIAPCPEAFQRRNEAIICCYLSICIIAEGIRQFVYKICVLLIAAFLTLSLTHIFIIDGRLHFASCMFDCILDIVYCR